jgi:riboflavin kinase/FMN adenylyltransferase
VLVEGFARWPAGPLHLTFGVFDGVHRGHRALIGELVAGARAAGARAVVGTFDVHPARVVAPQHAPLALSSAEEKIALLEAAGADDVVLWRFDRAFASLEAEEFVERIARAGRVRRVLVGFDLVFGHARRGDARLLRELGSRHGFDVAEGAPVAFEGAPISSSRIREALVAGDIATANAMLGREYGVRGTVVHGAGRGRVLGYPTINIATPSDRQLPADGIYAMRVAVGGETLPAAANLGVRPTFEASGARLLEAHLLDVERDLYGQPVDARFVARIRDERKFGSSEELTRQIAADVEAARAVLANSSAARPDR